MYDILIVGGGPAGLTAAVYARRAGKSVLVLEGTGFGGQIASSHLVENYPAIPAVSGADYSEALTAQAKALGAETQFGRVSGLRREGDGFVLTVRKKEFEGRAVILATGAKHRKLGVTREEELTGRGVSYCAVCDGAFFKGRDTAVVGGGDSALQAALFLSGVAKSVTLIHRRGEFRGQEANEAAVRQRENITLALDSQVVELLGENALSGLVLENRAGERRELAAEGLFIEVGQEPDNGLFSQLAQLDEGGYFQAGEDCRTGTPGIFVAGDCRAKELRQLTTAVADGSVAATAACQWLDR
ncbi:MAG: FAD-dependent oxidoreductase [Oscillospiraceae bacterium]|jgi:thioredoxin reductase (NADPH)|nr:FAD-dependent oxidoreductase [Oscillospiraceae bacterium]